MFKTLFIVFSLLILCVLPFGGTGHTAPNPILFEGSPPKFKVCVPTSEDDSNLEKRLQTFLKRELRSLGDVDLVSFDDEWKHLLQYRIWEIETKDGRKTGWLSMSYTVSIAVPKIFLASFKPEHPPVYPPNLGGGYWEADDLLEYAIVFVGNFDRDYLVKFREK
ncbi:hypothetical protein C6501_08030 [Candidatus Poribacteria bacterium]|nr:MAG: hypothetical protein C6501_08030 [Candidatus Poribacteria bacterium]